MPATLAISNETIRNLTVGTSAHPASDGDTTGSIGCEFEAVYRVTIGGTDDAANPINTWATRSLVFNPALFLPNGDPTAPPIGQGWAVSFPSGSIAGNTYPMTLVGQGTNAPANTNATCEARVQASPTQVDVVFRFRATMDLEGYITGLPLSNNDRLLKARRLDGLPFVNTQPSVYANTDTRVLKAVFTAFGNFPYRRERAQSIMGLRFYASGLTGAAEFGTCTTSILDAGGDPMTALSSFEAQTVRFEWPTGAGFAPTDDTQATIMLLDITTPGSQGGTYLQDYAAVITMQLVLNTGPTYRIDRAIGAGDLVAGHRYLVVVVVPVDDGSNYITNSYKLEARASATPTPLVMDAAISGTVIDYAHNPNTDNVVSTVVDRLVCRTVLLKAQYDIQAAATTWAGSVDDNLESVSVTVKKDGVPVFTRTVIRAGAVWPSDPLLVVSEDGSEVRADLLLAMAFPNEGGKPDFSGATVHADWTFAFRYPAVSDWLVHYTYRQQVEANAHGNFTKVVSAINLLSYETGLPLDSMCEDRVLVEVRLDPAQVGSDTWTLRAFAMRAPFGYDPSLGTAGMNEEESYASPVGVLPQSSAPIIELVQHTFTANRATFLFDATQVAEGERWRLYVVVQPQIAPSAECVDAFPVEPVNVAGVVFAQEQALYEGAGITVTGAGEPLADGFYAETGSMGGRPAYESGSGWFCQWTGSNWMIHDGSQYYVGVEDVPTPDLVTTWNALTAPAPAPAVTAGGVVVPDGTELFIRDHNTATPGTSLWEKNTGNVVRKVPAGTGDDGTDWEVVPLSVNDIVNDVTKAGTPEQYWQVYSCPAAQYSPFFDYSGKVGILYLHQIASLDPGPPAITNLQWITTFIGESPDWSAVDLCRTCTVQFTTDDDPDTATWVDSPLMLPVQVGSPPTWNGWAMFVGTFTANFPPTPGTKWIRLKWMRGTNLQGYTGAIYPTT